MRPSRGESQCSSAFSRSPRSPRSTAWTIVGDDRGPSRRYPRSIAPRWHALSGEVLGRGGGVSQTFQPPFLRVGRSMPLPHQLSCRPLRAGMAELEADLRLRVGVDEVDDAGPGGLLLVVHSPAQPGVMRASLETTTISVNIKPGPPMAREPLVHRWKSVGTPSSAEYMHIGESTARFATVMSRRRKGWNIGAVGFSTSTSKPGAHLMREQLVDLGDELRRAEPQVVVGDRLGAGHQAEGELHRVEVPEARDVLETRRARRRLRAGSSRSPRASPSRRPRARGPGRPSSGSSR